MKSLVLRVIHPWQFEELLVDRGNILRRDEREAFFDLTVDALIARNRCVVHRRSPSSGHIRHA